MVKQAKDGRVYRSRAEKLAVVAYKKEHGADAASAKFGVHGTQVSRWARGEGLGKTGGRGSAKKLAQELGHVKGNGAEPPQPSTASLLNLALRYMERWKNKQREHIRRGGVDNPYDVEAEHAYRILRGEE